MSTTKVKLFVLSVSALLLVLFCGCQAMPARPFQRPEELSKEEVINSLYERTHFFSTLTDSRISLRITHETEEGVERFPALRGYLIFDRMLPGLRMRTERFGQSIFSLRSFEKSFWLEIPDSRQVITGTETAYERMPQLIRPQEVLLWFASPEWLGLTWEDTIMDVRDDHYIFGVHLNGFPLRRVAVDRLTLNITSIVTYDIFGKPHTIVKKNRYRALNGSVFPYQIEVYRPGDGYKVRLRFDSPKFDHREFEKRHFEPATRRGWEHIDLDRHHPPVR